MADRRLTVNGVVIDARERGGRVYLGKGVESIRTVREVSVAEAEDLTNCYPWTRDTRLQKT